MTDSHEKTLVLLVDDHRPMLDYRQVRLQHDGFSVMAADSGLSALRMAESRKPDIVVTDIRMAGMDGYELCRKIRKRYDIPVILYSSYDVTEEKIQIARSIGAAVVLTSYSATTELAATIRRLLREEKEMAPADAARAVPALPSPAAHGSYQARS